MRLTVAFLLVLLALPLWAARNFTQTDTAAPQCSEAEAISCSSLFQAHTGVVGHQADESGTGGTTEDEVLISNGDPTRIGGWFESDQVGEDTSWPSGTWTPRINVTSADTQSIVSMRVCRVNSDCSSVLGTVGTDSTVTDLSTPGIKTWTISGASQSANTTDLFLVVWDLREDQAHGNSTVGYTPDQNIDTPLTAPAAGVGGKEGLLGNPITY